MLKITALWFFQLVGWSTSNENRIAYTTCCIGGVPRSAYCNACAINQHLDIQIYNLWSFRIEWGRLEGAFEFCRPTILCSKQVVQQPVKFCISQDTNSTVSWTLGASVLLCLLFFTFIFKCLPYFSFNKRCFSLLFLSVLLCAADMSVSIFSALSLS